MLWPVFVIGVVFCCCGSEATPPAGKPLWNSTWTDLLKRDLLVTYDKFNRPTSHTNTTSVNISLTITHIDIDEKKSIFSLNSWFRMFWVDDKMQWDPNNYGNMSAIHLANHEIWQPDILLYNSASDIDHYGNTHVIVGNTGKIIWVPPSTFESFCELDLTYWPFDTQHCHLIFGSWTYDGTKIDIIPTDDEISSEFLIKNNEWQLKNSSVERHEKYYSCCEEPYVSVQFNITVERRSAIYRAVVVVPAIVVILMTLATFSLPVASGQKILLCGANVITNVLLLMYFTQRLGNMAINTPLIVIFYSNTLYLVSFAMLISVAVINIANKKNSRRPIPWLLKKSLDGQLGKVLFIKSHSAQKPSQRDQELRDQPFDEHATSDDDHIIQLSSTHPIQEDWTNLATAIDRISILSYCAFFAFTAICYMV